MPCRSAWGTCQQPPRLPRLTLGVLWCTLVAGLGAACNPAPPDDTAAAILQVKPDDHVLAVGDPQVTVIEYADFECPACQWFAVGQFPIIRRDYIDTGKVRWIFRHSPLDVHPNAMAAAQASECAADQGKYWEYQELLFGNASGLSGAALKAYASQLGLDAAAFTACLDSGAKAAEVELQRDEGHVIGVPGTFAFFVNGNMVGGFKFASEFSQVLDEALADAAQ